MFALTEDRNRKDLEMRKAAVQTIEKLMEKSEDIMFFDADLANASGSVSLKNRFPEQFIEAGIAEANMIGMAAGMSTLGYIPFVHSFAPFISRRVFDQLFLSGAYAGNTINILASDPGFTAASNGGTHTTFEDVAMMRTIPDCVVADAADPVQLEWLLHEFAGLKGIHYVRTSRKAVRSVYQEGSQFQIGKGCILKDGKDVLIIAAGQLLSDALDAAEILAENGIEAEVIDPVTIKPLDEKLLIEQARGKRCVVTFENHNVTGGLGSAAAEVFMENGIAVPFKRIGIREQFGQVGSTEYLQKAFGLTADDLVDQITSLLESTITSPAKDIHFYADPAGTGLFRKMRSIFSRSVQAMF